MNRDEAREAAFEATKKETNLLGAWDDDGECPFDHRAMFYAGYDAGREDVASALRSALRELTNAWGYHQSEYVCEDPRLDEATANAERLLNGGK